jgi:hypothetical protein
MKTITIKLEKTVLNSYNYLSLQHFLVPPVHAFGLMTHCAHGERLGWAAYSSLIITKDPFTGGKALSPKT